MTGVTPPTLGSWDGLIGRVNGRGGRNEWERLSVADGRGEGVEGYTLTQHQQLGLGGSGVCIVLCAKATNRSHFFIPRGWLHRHYISRTLWWVMGNMVFAPQLFFALLRRTTMVAGNWSCDRRFEEFEL